MGVVSASWSQLKRSLSGIEGKHPLQMTLFQTKHQTNRLPAACLLLNQASRFRCQSAVLPRVQRRQPSERSLSSCYFICAKHLCTCKKAPPPTEPFVTTPFSPNWAGKINEATIICTFQASTTIELNLNTINLTKRSGNS